MITQPATCRLRNEGCPGIARARMAPKAINPSPVGVFIVGSRWGSIRLLPTRAVSLLQSSPVTGMDAILTRRPLAALARQRRRGEAPAVTGRFGRLFTR